MFPDRRASAVKTAIVMTARTTPYSAMVWPSSLLFSRSRRSKSFNTWFTFLRCGSLRRVPRGRTIRWQAWGRARYSGPELLVRRSGGVGLRDVAGDTVDRRDDVAREERERAKDGDRDDGE